MIKGILFDCGGVLVYPKNGYWQRPVDIDGITGGRKLRYDPAAAAAAFEKYSYILDEGQLISGLGHEYKLRLKFYTLMNEALGTGLSGQELHAIAHSLTYNQTRYALYGDTAGALEQLKSEGRYRIGFLSNAMPSMIRALTNSGIADGLDCFTVSCILGCQKPEERIYLTALRELELQPEECAFVEDLPGNLDTARRLGMKTIRMKRPFYCLSGIQDFVFDGPEAENLADVARLIHQMDEGRTDGCAG
ncbi:MAG: HAD-IA family hydrolase [Clostridia bacterium]|nr:HAD-IA family hydrolase [Clostridia bacterium]